MKQPKKEKQKLNKEQLQAIKFGEGPLLIIAGAGTGKTTTIVERIWHLIKNKKVKPEEILALTFTEKASQEMVGRVDEKLPIGLSQLWISTFHGFCERFLRAECLEIGLDPTYTLASKAECVQLMRSHLYDWKMSYFRPVGNPTKFITGLIEHIGRLQDEDISIEAYEAFAHKLQALPNTLEEEKEEAEKAGELARVYREYANLKIQENIMDYNDLISNTLKALRSKASLRKKYQTMFKYILVDEFQDTNIAQNELVFLLAGVKQNITVVGDDDQSIYKWRGAAISNILDLKKRLPKTKIVVLTKNYRSSHAILDASYRCIQHNNPDRLEVVEHIDKKLECMKRAIGKPIGFVWKNTSDDEAQWVAEDIEKQHESGKLWSDCTILLRANDHKEPFIRSLTRNNIPYQILGIDNILNTKEIKDIIAVLDILANPKDNVSLFRVMTMECFDIPLRDVLLLTATAKQQGISIFESFEWVSQKDQTVKIIWSPGGVEKLSAWFDQLHQLMSMIPTKTAGEILYRFLIESGLYKKFANPKTVSDEQAALNIAEFFSMIKSYETTHENATVFVVRDWIHLMIELKEAKRMPKSDMSVKDAVNIVTIHSAKGLEFDIVYMGSLVEGRFPSRNRSEQIPVSDALVKEIRVSADSHMQEERRLFYVGLTRAKEQLYLTGARWYPDNKREKKVSPFVIETLGQVVVDKEIIKPVETEKQLFLFDYAKESEKKIKEEAVAKKEIHMLSYSTYECFTRCPAQYKYRYVYKIPTMSYGALTFGDTVHRVMKWTYEQVRDGRPVDIKNVLEWYEKIWKKTGFQNPSSEKENKEKGTEIITEYMQTIFNPHTKVLSVEQSYTVPLTPTCVLYGKLDRIDDLGEGKIEIVDYKTGKSPTKKDIATDMQLSVYALLVSQQPKQIPPEQITVSLHFFEGQKKVSGVRTKEELQATKELMTRTVETIEKSILAPIPGKHCDFCEFKPLCEAWK